MPTRGMDGQIAADNAEAEEHWQKFGDPSAATLDIELRKARRVLGKTGFAQFPRGLIILVALWVVLLETADKLLLAYPQYEATLAEFQALLLRPEQMTAELMPRS